MIESQLSIVNRDGTVIHWEHSVSTLSVSAEKPQLPWMPISCVQALKPTFPTAVTWSASKLSKCYWVRGLHLRYSLFLISWHGSGCRSTVCSPDVQPTWFPPRTLYCLLKTAICPPQVPRINNMCLYSHAIKNGDRGTVLLSLPGGSRKPPLMYKCDSCMPFLCLQQLSERDCFIS